MTQAQILERMKRTGEHIIVRDGDKRHAYFGPSIDHPPVDPKLVDALYAQKQLRWMGTLFDKNGPYSRFIAA